MSGMRRGGGALLRAAVFMAAPRTGVTSSGTRVFVADRVGTFVAPPPIAKNNVRCFTASALAMSSSGGAEEKPATKVRNFAIIAHVDHGKTTLLDTLMNQGGHVSTSERLMDSNDLEKERGITISSKYTSFPWRDCVFNAVDTPGHADFGGEVERVLDMVDGCLLLVDAQEGPMAQTKFVLSKALQKGLHPVVCINKVDRPGVTKLGCDEVESKLFDLFANMGATDSQLDFAIVYASAREGVAHLDFHEARRLCGGDKADKSVAPLLDVLLDRVPPPPGDPDDEFKLLVSMIEHDAFVGRLVTGRVASGRVAVGDRVKAMKMGDGGDGDRETGRVTKVRVAAFPNPDTLFYL
jgi:GTP-binding protein|tara:strand:+ start:4112 stop:5167 length:1056 start_codon:yes stop_codon:yes gene_type:complete